MPSWSRRVGTGFGGPTFMIMYQNAIPHKQLGAAWACCRCSASSAPPVGTALAGSIVGAGAVAASQPALAAAVHQAFLVELAAAILVLITAWFTVDRPLRTSIRETEEEGRTASALLATVELA